MMFQNFLYSREENDDFRNFVLKNKYDFDQTVAHLLFALGFHANLCGVRYLREAIKYCYELMPAGKISFNKTIYPEVAKRCNTTSARVERNIRTAIHTCYYCGDLRNFNIIAQCPFVSSQYPPTNSEFIMQIADWLYLELGKNAKLSDGGGY